MKDLNINQKELSKELKVANSVLDAFDLLKSPKDETKITGGAKIISILQDSENSKDKQYALKRLVRSLGANNPEMRIAYFATLVTMLNNLGSVSVTELLELITKELHASGSSKSEIGDVSLGQILVCGAIFRSGLIWKASLEEKIETVKTIFTASKKKSYLNILAYFFILDLCNDVDDEQFGDFIWCEIKDAMKKDINEHSLDTLYFVLMLNKKFPSKVKLKKMLGVDEILSEGTIHIVCEKLMASIDLNTVNHPIYNEIGIMIANSTHLKSFWTSGIDSQLTKHNRNKELVALNLLTVILNNMRDNYDVIPELISKNFFKLFMDWFKGLQTASKVRNWRDDEDDQKIMIKKEKELLNTLAKTLKSANVESRLKVETLKKLMFHPGEMNFSEVTGTNFVKTIIADLDKSGVKKMAKLFKGVLLNTSKKIMKGDLERSWYNNERLKAAEGLSYLVCHEAVKDDIDFKLNYMKLLMCFGFFKIGGDEDVAVSSELAGAIKSSFYRCFSSRFSNVDNLLAVLSALCEFINSNIANEKIREKMVKQFSTENMECWEMLMTVSQKVNKNENKTKVEKVFLILLWQLGLYLFSEPKSIEMAKSSIKELKSCYEHYKKDLKEKRKKPLEEGDLVEDEPEWIEVLVEVLLSVLSTESSILRLVVQCVFRLLWEYLTPNAVGQIISVLDPDNENNPLTYKDDESDDSDESDDDGGEVKSDEPKNKDDGTDDNGSDTEIENDEGEDMKTPEQLRLAVQKALGNAVMDSDAESIDADMIDEEEGKKLDEALSEAFKMFHQPRNKKSKEEKKDKKALSDFRIRVLDLIDIYLEKDPPMDVCLGMIPPLIRCLEFSIQDNQFKELENRCRKTIKILTKIRKFSFTADVTIGILCDYLRSIIEKGHRSHYLFQAIGDVITQCGSFIVHCALKIAHQNKDAKNESLVPLVDIYKESLSSFFQNRNCSIPIIFFHSILQIDWEGNYELAPLLVENAFNDTVRQFRRNEALELLTGFYRALKRLKPQSDLIESKLSSIEKLLAKAVNESLNGSNTHFTAKNNFFLILKKLINNIKAFHESSHLDSSFDFEKLLNMISTNKNSIMIKSKETENKKINPEPLQRSNGKNRKKSKRKAEQTNGEHLRPNKKLKMKSNVIPHEFK